MAIILFHSSKTMRSAPLKEELRRPQLLDKTLKLDQYLKILHPAELAQAMKLSEDMSQKTWQLINAWSVEPKNQSPAIDSFLGDMYSGLQASELSSSDRLYADQHLKILSGLYGVLRPLDGIMPYRLEMGYKFADPPFDNLYDFWGNSIATTFSDDKLIFNLSSVEYTKAVLPHLAGRTVVTPKFMTLDKNSGQPRQVVVHSKVARGAFVRWLVENRINSLEDSQNFDRLGYRFQTELSSPTAPVYVCQEFGGLGLSLRT